MAWDELLADLTALDSGDSDAAARIRNQWGTTCAVLVCDMSGFSRIAHHRGIEAFLALIARMHRLCLPLIEQHRGRLVKAEADNLLAVFANPSAALDAALAMHACTVADGRSREQDDQVRLCMGIGYGPILDIGEDIFGDEVNLASKLGEDLADPGEILLTARAADPLEQRLQAMQPESHILALSGLKLAYWRVHA